MYIQLVAVVLSQSKYLLINQLSLNPKLLQIDYDGLALSMEMESITCHISEGTFCIVIG